MDVRRTDNSGSNIIFMPDTAAYQVETSANGKIIILSDLTADVVVALPLGLTQAFMVNFIYGGNAADAQDWTITAGATQFINGGVTHLDSNADAAADEVVTVYGDGTTDLSLNVLTPGAGTDIAFLFNGSEWTITGVVVSATVPVIS